TSLASVAGTGNLARALGESTAASIVAYVSLDREFSEPLLNDFEKQSGISIRAKYDVESTKTIGLVNLVRSEAARPRADLFWNNEIINTIRLKKLGLLASARPTAAADFPAIFQDREHFWHGFAARARVLIVNPKMVGNQAGPKSIHDLADPRWKGKVGIAKPFFGTTATHCACLYALWGERQADDFFAALHRNQVQVMAGNKPVAEAVAAGKLAFGLTDTDDALVIRQQGHQVELVYPDSDANGLGTLFIPNTLAMIKGGPNSEGAARLLDWLYRPETETRLSAGPSGQIPLSAMATKSGRVESPTTVKPMPADFEKAAELFDNVMKRLAGLFG
ncbi:MAG: extracellular solute-binding protein, partial [bacterium]